MFTLKLVDFFVSPTERGSIWEPICSLAVLVDRESGSFAPDTGIWVRQLLLDCKGGGEEEP